MSEHKQNWKYIAMTAAGFVVVLSAIYYVNCVYLPNRALERAIAMDAETMAAKQAAEEKAQSERTYSFSINTELGQRRDDNAAGSSDEGMTVTTDENGVITIDRVWDVDTGDLPVSAGPGSPIANIGGGGGEKITGEDGAYHGEQPATQTPENGSSGSGTEADSKNDGKPDSGKTGETPSTPSTPASGTDSKPSSTGGSGTNGGSSTGGNSSSGSSKPKDGDIRIVDGKEQMYWDGFGWVDKGDGGHTDYWDVGGDSGIYVGSMG